MHFKGKEHKMMVYGINTLLACREGTLCKFGDKRIFPFENTLLKIIYICIPHNNLLICILAVMHKYHVQTSLVHLTEM